MEKIMLKIDNVSKQYKLGQIGGTTLRDELQRKRAKLRGEEDPTRKIGAKDYNKGETFMALNGVSFEVKKGERVGIIGHNGAGKSTLLKLISRVTAPTGGAIYMNGRVASMLEVGTGFHGELTGRENIYMNGAILGMTKKEIDAKIEDIIEFSECRQFIDTPVKRYSSGMYVKLAFSVAAHLDSEIMIMDEVLAVGDMAFQKKCLDKMNDVSRQQGRTILYVSHNMNTIRQLCDRVIVLDHGKVVFDGAVEEGIEVYMDTNADTRLFYDYSAEKNNYRQTVKLRSLEILDHSTNQFAIGEKIRFCLKVFGNETVDEFWIRFEVKYGDLSVVGTTFVEEVLSIQKGETKLLTVELPTDSFTNGKYHCVVLVYERGDYGRQVPLDRVFPGLSFELINADEKAVIWNHSAWGHIRLPDMKLLEVTTDTSAVQ